VVSVIVAGVVRNIFCFLQQPGNPNSFGTLLPQSFKGTTEEI
jgi:hypothetical protein